MRLRDGGVVRAVLDLCSLLASAGHEVTLMCCGEAEVPREWGASSAAKAGGRTPKVVRLGVPGAAGLLPRTVLAQAEPNVSAADVVHLHGMWELSNHQIAAMCRRMGRPYVYSPHGMLDDWSMGLGSLKKRVVLSLGARRTLEHAACVHFAAQGEMEQSSKRFRGRARVAPLMFDLEPFRELPGPSLAREKWPRLAGERPVVLFLSRLVENKGPDIVIGAVGHLKREGLEPQLVIAGGGDDRYVQGLHDMAAAEGIDPLFAGHVDGKLKLSLIQNAAVFVLPTIHENFGFATLEAIACGVPAVTTPGNLLRNELQESGGVVIAERGVAQVAAATGEVLSDPNRREQMGREGRSWVFSTLRPAAVLEQFTAMYSGAEAPGSPRL